MTTVTHQKGSDDTFYRAELENRASSAVRNNTKAESTAENARLLAILYAKEKLNTDSTLVEFLGPNDKIKRNMAMNLLNLFFSDEDLDRHDEAQEGLVSPTSIPQFLQSTLLHHPRLIIGVSLASLLICAAYVGLGYWWVLSHNASQAAEPLGLLGVQEQSHSSWQKQTPGLTNLHALQNQSSPSTAGQGGVFVPPEPKEKDAGSSSLGTLVAMSGVAMSEPAQEITVESIKQDLKEPSGRPDPFSPLVEPADPLGQPNSALSGQPDAEKKPEKRDVLVDLQYTGFIGDAHSKDKVAIIKVSDPLAGGTKTLIKKVGDSFLVEGERAVLKAVSKNGLQVTLSGQTRWLELHPYVEMTGNAAGRGSANSGSASASGATGSSSAAGASTSAGAGPDGLSVGSGNAGTSGASTPSGSGPTSGTGGGSGRNLSLQEQ
jgi:hypothetical protein